MLKTVQKLLFICGLTLQTGCSYTRYNNGISFKPVDRRSIVVFEPFEFSSNGGKISTFGSMWGYPGFKDELNISFILNVPPEYDILKNGFISDEDWSKVLDSKNGVLKVTQKIRVAPPPVLDKAEGIELHLRILNTDIVEFYKGKVKGAAPDIECCFLPDGTPVLEVDILFFAAANPTAGKQEFINAMRRKYDFDPGRKGNGRVDFCGNPPYYYLADGTPVYAYDAGICEELYETRNAFLRHVRQFNHGKAEVICKIRPIINQRYGLEIPQPDFKPIVTVKIPEFIEFRYLSDLRYQSIRTSNIPEEDLYKDWTDKEFEQIFKEAQAGKNQRYKAYSHKIPLPPIPEIVKLKGFVQVSPVFYFHRHITEFSRAGEFGLSFYTNGLPECLAKAENFFAANRNASEADFLRQQPFDSGNIMPEKLWKKSDSLPYCLFNGKTFSYWELKAR